MLIHVVQSGETIASIARQYGVDPLRLSSDNGVIGGQLAVGQALAVQFPEVLHTVQTGETLSSIARQYGLSLRQLLRNNYSLQGRSQLNAGQVLVISYLGEKLGTAATGGYAYPYIPQEELDAALPYMTLLAPFTYGITASGGLLHLEDQALLASARSMGVLPFLHLSSLTEDGQFSSQRVSMVLEDPALQTQLIEQVAGAVVEKGYQGVDIDFEFVPPEQGAAYGSFVAQMRRRMGALGYPVMVALAPKTYAGQPGLLYEAHDYALLGQAADFALLMTYEWGYAYGPPMAVAPLPNVRQVVEYAVTEIAPQQLLLGIPTYGYDWPLPFQQGVTSARSLSNPQAVELARRYQAAVQYDESAQAPYFYYADGRGTEHVVWFEDARSIAAKCELIAQYGLQGAGFWNLMRPFPQGWVTLNALLEIL